jgi:hypothetical protein
MTSGFLIDNIDDKDKTVKWFEILSNVVDGYNSIISLTYYGKKAIPIMMPAI